ncbi:hypothetical protein CEXT_673361 [Caerostris extrusa]|uniref:Uncharacterized protein n=1 Tax=Caerostris extrusa TaxID=172846 RepID=A0AAV4Y5V0_CAEEX|nr:hypothetical protein CEXT_673361 [Caerostris extrusa]
MIMMLLMEIHDGDRVGGPWMLRKVEGRCLDNLSVLVLVVIDWMATEDKRHPLTPSGGQEVLIVACNSETPCKENPEVVSPLVDYEFYIFVQTANWETATLPGPFGRF